MTARGRRVRVPQDFGSDLRLDSQIEQDYRQPASPAVPAFPDTWNYRTPREVVQIHGRNLLSARWRWRMATRVTFLMNLRRWRAVVELSGVFEHFSEHVALLM